MSESRNKLSFPLRGNNYENSLPPEIFKAAAGSDNISSKLGSAVTGTPPAQPVQTSPPPQPQTNAPQQVSTPRQAEPPRQTAASPVPAVREAIPKNAEPYGYPQSEPVLRPRIGRIAAAVVILAALSGTIIFLLVHKNSGKDEPDKSGDHHGHTDSSFCSGEEGTDEYTGDEASTEPGEDITAEPTEDNTEAPTQEIEELPKNDDGSINFLMLDYRLGLLCSRAFDKVYNSDEYKTLESADYDTTPQKLDMLFNKNSLLLKDGLIKGNSWKGSAYYHFFTAYGYEVLVSTTDVYNNGDISFSIKCTPESLEQYHTNLLNGENVLYLYPKKNDSDDSYTATLYIVNKVT